MEAAIDFSIWALFSRATLPVQLVMILLIGLSVWSWTIAINKRLALIVARRRAAKFDQSFWSGEPLDELFDRISGSPKGGSELIFNAGMTEWRRSHRDDGAMIAGAQSRIERSFQSIAVSKNTSLAVVAPGIAEALLATGLGLLAAIPAVVFYNHLSAASDRVIANYEAFADEFSTILSRQLGG